MLMRASFVAWTLIFSLATLSLGQGKEKDKDKKEPKDLDGLKALRHPDLNVRYKAAIVLVKLGPVGKFASAELREAFNEEKNAYVKIKMAEAIWSVDRPVPSVILPSLLEALKDKRSDVRTMAVGAIGQMGPKGKPATPQLLEALKDKDAPLRIAAIVALGEVGAKDAVGPLLDAIQEDSKDYLIDTMVASALGKLGPSILPKLEDALKDKLARRRLAAVYALGELGPAAAPTLPALVVLLKGDDDLAHQMVLQALGRIGKDAQKAVKEVEPLLKAKAPAVRLEAAQTLLLVDGQTKHLPLILECLNDDKLGLVEEACLALKHFGPKAKEAADSLTKRLKTKDPHVRMAAAIALFHVAGKTEEAFRVFEVTLDDSDASIRRRTLEYLEEMGPAALPMLAVIQDVSREDDDDQVRQAAKSALLKMRKNKG